MAVRFNTKICSYICNLSSVERLWLIEGLCSVEHVAHLMMSRAGKENSESDLPWWSDNKQVSYIFDFGSVESSQWLIENCCLSEHVAHLMMSRAGKENSASGLSWRSDSTQIYALTFVTSAVSKDSG